MITALNWLLWSIGALICLAGLGWCLMALIQLVYDWIAPPCEDERPNEPRPGIW